MLGKLLGSISRQRGVQRDLANMAASGNRGRIGRFLMGSKEIAKGTSKFVPGATRDIGKSVGWYAGAGALEELGERTENDKVAGLTGVASWYMRTRGFRSALRAPLQGVRAASSGRIRGASDWMIKKYNQVAYWPDRAIAGVAKRTPGGAKNFMLGSRTNRVPGPFRPIYGAAEVMSSVVGGSMDRLRYGLRTPTNRGVMGRLMRAKHPYWGAVGMGAALGATRSVQQREHLSGTNKWYAAPKGGINPSNYRSITFENSRGYRRTTMGSDRMSQRMASGGMR